MKRVLLIFIGLLTKLYFPAQARVEVEASPSLASYAERREAWSILIGVGNLQNDFGVWENNSQIDLILRRKVGESVVDLGGLFQHRMFGGGFHQNALGIGIWLSRLWQEPYVVPVLTALYNQASEEVSSFVSYQVGVLLGLSWLESDSYFRLRKEFGVQHSYLEISYFKSSNQEVLFSGYLLGVKMEW